MKDNIIADDAIVDVTVMNNIVEIRENIITHFDNSPKIKEFDSKHFINVETGELCSYPTRKQNIHEKQPQKKKTSRLSSPKSLRRTRKYFKNLIITNFSEAEKTLFVTFKYDEIVTDHKRASNDMSNIIRRMKRKYESDDNKMKYIYILEHSYNDNTHIHCIFCWSESIPENLNVELPKLWKNKGETFIEQINDNESILYLATYLTMGAGHLKNTMLNPKKIAKSNEEKAEIKHSRLIHFKPNERFFRHSNNMKQPTKETMTYKEAKAKYEHLNNINSNTYEYKNEVKGIKIEQKYEYKCKT